ncbi:MAG TPA: VOC family protein [Cyclobacteriaceae bacterium]|nr:VOC family protein [Cyclobacteriaceae bacterium]
MNQKTKPAPNLLIPFIVIGFMVCASAFRASILNAQAINHKTTTQMITLTSYLLLDGTCKPAMEFYQSCFGGQLSMTTVGDSPMKDFFPAALHNRVVNARLVSGNISISASDWLRPQETPVQGNTVCLYLSGGTYRELKTLFEKLSKDAKVTDPLKEEAFGMYGALNDKFGIRWMFHAEKEN